MLITEKRIYRVDPVALQTDGTVSGKLSVPDSSIFRVGQIVILKAGGQPNVTLKINRIDPVDKVSMFLGPVKQHISKRADISAYTVAASATIEANEQERPTVPEQEVERITYEEEPVVARRTILVDKYGCRIDDDNPLPTTAELNVDNLEIPVEIDAKDGDNVAISAHPNQIFDQAANSITTTDATQIYTYTSTNADTKIAAIQATVDTPARFSVKLDGVEIRRFYTSGTQRNAIFDFKEHRSLGVGSIITVEAQVWRINGSQTYVTFTSLEGYIA